MMRKKNLAISLLVSALCTISANATESEWYGDIQDEFGEGYFSPDAIELATAYKLVNDNPATIYVINEVNGTLANKCGFVGNPSSMSQLPFIETLANAYKNGDTKVVTDGLSLVSCQMIAAGLPHRDDNALPNTQNDASASFGNAVDLVGIIADGYSSQDAIEIAQGYQSINQLPDYLHVINEMNNKLAAECSIIAAPSSMAITAFVTGFVDAYQHRNVKAVAEGMSLVTCELFDPRFLEYVKLHRGEPQT